MRSMAHMECSPISSHCLAKFTTFVGFVNGAGLTKARPIFAIVSLLIAYAGRFERFEPICRVDQANGPFQVSHSAIYRRLRRRMITMEAATFKLKTPYITGGRSHIPLAKTEHMTVGLNYYTPGRKNKLHTHPGEDHIFVVMDGQATFYNKDHHPTVR